MVNIKIDNLENLLWNVSKVHRSRECDGDALRPGRVLRTRSSWPGFVHASPPADDGEADYKHDVISLSILISLSQGQKRLANTRNNEQ